MSFSGKTVLITGAQQGIGHASAVAFAKAGANVAVHYLDDRARAFELVDEIVAMGRRAVAVRADLAEEAAAASVVHQAEAALGPIDVAVNNAGIFRRAAFADLTAALWDLTLDVNLRATAFVCQAAVKSMRQNNVRGAIVNVSSVAAHGTPLGVHYSASKGGMDALTRAIALDVARDGIRVNAVAPGIILTAQALEGNDLEALQALAAKTLPGRPGAAAEVASVILFLASDAASFINGEIIAVNGGAHMA